MIHLMLTSSTLEETSFKQCFKSIQRLSVFKLTCTLDTLSCVVTIVLIIVFNDFYAFVVNKF